MSDDRRQITSHEGSHGSFEAAAMAAYRRAEPVRQRDPFHGLALQQAVASEASARAVRQRGGPLAWLARWLQDAPRPALAGAALSLALLATGAPLAAVQTGEDPGLRGSPAAVMSEISGAEPVDARSREVGGSAEPVGASTGAPWLLVAGAVGFAVSILAVESVRRRRRA